MLKDYMETKEINTERLKLRKFKKSDDKEIFNNWISDPEVAKYMVWNPQKNISETKEWLKKCISKYKKTDTYNWGIELKDDGHLIGSISANKLDDNGCYEIGYTIGRRYWGNGYATESLKAVVNYLSNEEKIKRLFCRSAKENIASIKVIKKAGFKYKSDGKFTTLDGQRTFKSEEYYLEVVKGDKCK